MKDKDGFWVKSPLAGITELPGCLSTKIQESKAKGTSSTLPSSIHYIWLHVTREGITSSHSTSQPSTLSLSDWLNIVDESATLGAQWMIIHVNTCLKSYSDVWRICSWAQEVHGIRVGLHLNHECMDAAGLAPIRGLDRDETFVVVDSSALEAMEFLRTEGYSVCESNIGTDDRKLPCSHTQSIVCVGADGVMFCCGMVVGDESYHLGDVISDSVQNGMANHSSLQPIGEHNDRPGHSCNGCPPFMVQRFKEQQQQQQ